MRYVFIVGFLVMVGAQWFVPLDMIFGAEKVIDQGVEFRFKTAPVDPSDPFRGKYITLDFAEARYHSTTASDTAFVAGQNVYALLLPDSAGYAKIVGLLAEQPEDDLDYFEAKVSYVYGTGEIFLTFPFQRFYVEESKASEAEKLYWENNRRDSAVDCYAKVMIHRGKATLTDVMIGDRSIVDLVKEINESED